MQASGGAQKHFFFFGAGLGKQNRFCCALVSPLACCDYASFISRSDVSLTTDF